MIFVTFSAVACWWGLCTRQFNETTIPVDTIEVIEEHDYYWRDEVIVQDNGDYKPKDSATLMNGCYIVTHNGHFFYDFPCSEFRKLIRKCDK